MESSYDIVQIIYCSHATHAEVKSDFERDVRDILDHSRTYNLLHEITSALMTDGGMFAHVIEGPAVAVENLYFRVARDPRHDRVLMLQRTVVHVRLFNLWPITFLRVGTLGHTRMLDAWNTPTELRKASISILKAFRPMFLK